MKNWLVLWTAITLAAWALPANAQDEAPPLAGDPTQILVLGTPHLSGREEITDEVIAPLIERLEAFAPDFIVIEAVSGQTCHVLRNYANIYPGVADNYCVDPDPVLEQLGMSQPEAELALMVALAEDTSEPQERRRLIALLFATGDPWSAIMHWRMLDVQERVADASISAALAERLDRSLNSRNENNSIAATLAMRLGHLRLHAMDDHLSDSILVGSTEDLWPTMQSIWASDIGVDPALAERRDALAASDDMIAYLRLLNSEQFQAMTHNADFGAAAATPDADFVARHYVAWWHARNLRMAANIVAATGNAPGARVLVLTGASHKRPLDIILGTFPDIELVEVSDILSD